MLLASVTFDPPVDAACTRVTVHVLVALCPWLVGLHATPDTRTGASRLMLVACALAPIVAVTVAF